MALSKNGEELVCILGTVAVSREGILADLAWNKEVLRRAVLSARQDGYRIIFRHLSDGIATEYFLFMDAASVKRAGELAAAKEEPTDENV